MPMSAIKENATAGPLADFPGPGCVAMADPADQFYAIAHLALVLKTYYEQLPRPDAFVAGNMELYYNRQGAPVSKLAPDLMVVFGAAGRPRSSFRIWEQGKAPDFVLEVVSRSTWRRDRGRKKEIYASIGVREYWLFDPTGAYFKPRLEGYRLEHGAYVALQPNEGGGEIALWSEVLGLWLRAKAATVEVLCDYLPPLTEPLAERLEGKKVLEVKVQFRREAETGRDATAQARRESETKHDATAQARHEAETNRDATAQTRRESETNRDATAQARRESETNRDATAQTRRESEARADDLERQLEVSPASGRTRRSRPKR